MFNTQTILLLFFFVIAQSQCRLDNPESFWLWDDRACLIDTANSKIAGVGSGQGDFVSYNRSQKLIEFTSAPWTRKPSCSQTHSNQQYCTFTDSKLSNGRGISIVTTPDIAAQISDLAIFRESSQSSPRGSSISPPYTTQDIPGKGVGLVATRTLFTGDMIFAYPPASIHHNGIFQSMPMREKEFIVRDSINRLPLETRKLWWNLDWQGSRDDLAEDIINTNSFKVFLGKNKTLHSMMSPEMSRMNHDCRPNVRHRFLNSTFSHAAYASRTIFAGEELTISYIDPLMPFSQRHQVLRRGWGFNCTCSLCSQEPSLRTVSDQRIQLIHELKSSFADWTADTIGTPEMAELLVSLYEQERLYGWMGDAYEIAALVWNTVREEWKAKRYAALAVQFHSFTNRKGKRDNDMAGLLKNPKLHWSSYITGDG